MQSTAWGVTGAALECFDAALSRHNEASGFGPLLGQTQLFQQKLADMAGLLVSSQLMSLHFGRLEDMDQLTPLQVPLLAKAWLCI